MSVILGIDAAWTEHGSSGIALLRVDGDAHRLLCVAHSYEAFIERPDLMEQRRPGSSLDVSRILETAERIAGARVDVVAIDMPMSLNVITGSRMADRLVAHAFGAMQAAPYTPRPDCPGPYGRRVMEAFNRAGFPLRTSGKGKTPALLEVFPLAALARLTGGRPMYKAARTTRYWKGEDRPRRMTRLLANWTKIEEALGREMGDLALKRPSGAQSFASLKPFEDALDAVICAWVGACYLRRSAQALGDEQAAIWVPLLRGDTR